MDPVTTQAYHFYNLLMRHFMHFMQQIIFIIIMNKKLVRYKIYLKTYIYILLIS